MKGFTGFKLKRGLVYKRKTNDQFTMKKKKNTVFLYDLHIFPLEKVNRR